MRNSGQSESGSAVEFRGYAASRVVVGLVLAVGVLWLINQGLGYLKDRHPSPVFNAQSRPLEIDSPPAGETSAETHDIQATTEPATLETVAAVSQQNASVDSQADHPTPAPQPEPELPAGAPLVSQPQVGENSHAKATAHETPAVVPAPARARGVAFVAACIKPLDYELNHRFYGWRPNDILDVTDNVNKYQLGVLEVTRRTAVVLAERISRTGTNEAFDKQLERAMNWFMIKADKYWFPSPESKYNAGLDEMRKYMELLARGEANFYTRADNLIPLLMVFEDLLGSCEENLVKAKEKNGKPVSFFMADEYFFYAKGVAGALYTILQAVAEDFGPTVASRHGTEVLHHAIESCRHAVEIDPLIITNSGLSGIFANHRANMAAPISHARFYVGVLIKTLST